MIYALHGMMGHHTDWNVLDMNLQEVDLWESLSSDNKSVGLEDWAQSFNQSIPNDGQAMLMGYSMGGRLALHALLNHPNSWKGVVVISTHPGLQNEEEKQARLENDQQWVARAKELPWAGFLALWNDQLVLRSGNHSKSQAALEPIRECVAQAFECWSLANQADLRPALADCNTPVLWITGGQDEKFTQLAEQMSASNDQFEHVVISGVGHRILFEKGAALKKLKKMIGDFQKRIL